MAGYKSASFDPDAVATASDAASSALAAMSGVSDAASAATAKAAAASSKIAAQSSAWETGGGAGYWQITSAQSITVAARTQYPVFHMLDNQGTITLAAGAELIIH